ncbi:MULTISPECIES: hypothetical protein [unclassified Kitasatospora]|uniref:hypothetical protein n=1 Tax=unclassified Kitasatospora TaxID=2633591 RepID=UPI0007C6DF51|nr:MULTISPECIES: hypothetical protein [unclassified Kitasatospora]
MLIKGYDDGFLAPGEPLLDRGGFWASHLLGMCALSPGERPEPEWFGDDGADTDALAEVLLDERVWPVFRVPFEAGHALLVVYRNFAGDYGVDYLLDHPDWGRAEAIASFDGDWSGLGLSWPEVTRLAGACDPAAAGVQAPAARLLLLLPVLCAEELPADATEVVRGALVTVGVPGDVAPRTAERVLAGRRGALLPPSPARSPLSGGESGASDGEPDSFVLRMLGITRQQAGLLARALGSTGGVTT